MNRLIRTPSSVALKKRMLILCEGDTEVKYFNGLKHDEAHRRKLASLEIDIFQPEDFSPLGLVKEAKRRAISAKRERNPYDTIWVVFDRNGHQKIPEAFDMAKSNCISVAFSIICFEYWILLHFERTTRAYNRCADLIHDLVRHYPGYDKAVNHYALLKSRTQAAMGNSNWVAQQAQLDLDRGMRIDEMSSYTNVHELVSELIGP
jgi:hypothetical protein